MLDDEFSPRVNDLHGQTGSVIASALFFSPLLHPRCSMPFTRTYINYSKLVYALRYEILEVIGKGSFGQVIRALDHKTGQHIAIKIIRYAETVYSSRDDSHRELRSEKKRRDVSAMNNVRCIRHFSGCVRFPSVPWRFFINSGGFHCPCRNKKRFHHQALIEVRILEHLRKKDLEANSQHNVIHMLEYFYFRNHLCISFELMR